VLGVGTKVVARGLKANGSRESMSLFMVEGYWDLLYNLLSSSIIAALLASVDFGSPFR
jgi:hypothetical protein